MSRVVGEQINADLAESQRAMDTATARVAEHNLASQRGDWEAVERLRVEVLALVEASLDAYARACKRLENAKR